MITVWNRMTTLEDIEVAINKWGTEGYTGFFTIHSNAPTPETWDRSSDLGFVMAVRCQGEMAVYYVLHNSSIEIKGLHEVYDHGVRLTSITRAFGPALGVHAKAS